MNIEEFLLSPDSLLTRVHFKKSKISAYETAEACSHRLSELQQQGASTAMFDSFSSQKAQILGGMVKKITWDGEPLVRAPYRKDWLYLEEKMVHLLNFIAWIGMFKEEVFRVSHWEQCLIRFCQHIGCAASAERALEPGPDKERVRHILNILIHTLDWIKKEHEAYEEDWKEPYLRKLAAQTEHDTSDNAIEENWNGLRVLEEGLAATPGHIGTLLTGSFAVESHRDSFSDLDVFAVFEQVPSDEMRDDLRLRLKVTNPLGSRTGGFEYFRLRQADIHFMVFERKHIDDTLTRFEQVAHSKQPSTSPPMKPHGDTPLLPIVGLPASSFPTPMTSWLPSEGAPNITLLSYVSPTYPNGPASGTGIQNASMKRTAKRTASHPSLSCTTAPKRPFVYCWQKPKSTRKKPTLNGCAEKSKPAHPNRSHRSHGSWRSCRPIYRNLQKRDSTKR